MSTPLGSNADVQKKLREGLKLLAEAVDVADPRLGLALIKLHGALEDHLRIEIARKAPHLRQDMEDTKKTNWRDLIIYSKQYLGMTETDARTVTRANSQRQDVAHGGNYSGTRNELIRYATFVQKWCGISEPLRPASLHRQSAEIPAARSQHLPKAPVTARPTGSSPGGPPPAEARQAARARARRTSWSRTVLFLFGAFCICALAGLSYVYTAYDSSAEPGSTRPPEASPTPVDQPPVLLEDTPVRPASLAETGTVCVIVWVEYPSDRLTAKNRSMVWEEFVMEQVRGSGMTDREFYDQVVERNPQLVTDGYEFKRGKTYLLPECD